MRSTSLADRLAMGDDEHSFGLESDLGSEVRAGICWKGSSRGDGVARAVAVGANLVAVVAAPEGAEAHASRGRARHRWFVKVCHCVYLFVSWPRASPSGGTVAGSEPE